MQRTRQTTSYNKDNSNSVYIAPNHKFVSRDLKIRKKLPRKNKCLTEKKNMEKSSWIDRHARNVVQRETEAEGKEEKKEKSWRTEWTLVCLRE